MTPRYAPVVRVVWPRRSLRWYFDHNDGHLIHKWLHYFPVYERHLAPFRGRRVTMLEIGVSHGGSLQMWKHYLGRRSTIVGIDIDPRVRQLEEPGIHVLVGDQSDPEFLASLCERFGPFDVVLDDGGHFPQHQIASITHLWPSLKPGGVYLVEDLHTSYWARYGAGRRHPDSFVSWLHDRIDDMHAYHSEEEGFDVGPWTRTLDGIHIHDSIVALERADREPPVHRRTGRPAFDDLYGTPVEATIDQHHRAQLAALNRPIARLRRAFRDPAGTTRRLVRRLRRD